jgi:hypothetical protein
MLALRWCWLGCLAVSSLLSCSGAPAPVAVFSEQDARSVVEPLRFGWLSSERETGSLPSAIALGGKTSGRVLVYLEFPDPESARRLLRAELLLRPRGAAGGRVPIEVSRAEAAQSELVRWSDQPKALYPRLSAQLSVRPWPERVDVTEILRAHARRREPLRQLLRAEPGEGEGVLLATGASGGESPRLELYWQ